MNFIVDFFCHELELAIELDGSVHVEFDNPEYDKARQQLIEEHGIHFLRFRNQEVFDDVNTVIRKVEEWIDANAKKGPLKK